MAKGRIRVNSTKGNKWKKGESGSSNPKANKHRLAARGKFDSHLATANRAVESSLTSEALVAHALEHEDVPPLSSAIGETSIDDREDGSQTATSAHTSSVYSYIEAAHPLFGKVKTLWNSSLESHREICAVLAAVSEVIRTKEGKNTEVEYFATLMTALESTTDDEKAAASIAFLLSLVLPKVPVDVLQARCGAICKILMDTILAHNTSESCGLLRALVACLSTVLGAQPEGAWSESYLQRVFLLLLNFTVHAKPKLRKVAQGGVVSVLKEGTLGEGNFHPVAPLVAKHCKHVLESSGEDTSRLHILGMLKECLSHFPTEHIKSLCEAILKLMTLGNAMVRTTSLQVFHGLFSSLTEPQGLTAELCGRLISALYEYQPSLVDAQLLQAWLTVMLSAHTKLCSLQRDLGLAHLPLFITACIKCLESDKRQVTKMAASVVKTLLKDCIAPYLQTLKPEDEDAVNMKYVQKSFKAVESSLKYGYQSSWDLVLGMLGTFYEVAGKQCHKIMAKSLLSLCELRGTADFPHSSKLDETFGAAVTAMGPRIVLSAVPMQLDTNSATNHEFPRGWILPVLKEHVKNTELGFFVQDLLPLAAKMRAKSQQYQSQPVIAKVYDILQTQIWSLLPGFCTNPSDLATSFPSIAPILGKALTNDTSLAVNICQSLSLLVSGCKTTEDKALVGRFSKNYLPILFNLYSEPSAEAQHKGPILDSIQAYLSVTEQKLIESLFEKILLKLEQQDLPLNTKYLVLDLAQTFVPFLPVDLLTKLFTFITSLMDSADATLQKKAYSILKGLLSCEGPVARSFVMDHMEQLSTLLLESLSTSSTASKKPRLKCLLQIVSRSDFSSVEFLTSIIPEVILCTKEVNEKARALAYDLLVAMGNAAQHCYKKNAEDSMTAYIMVVLAGLAGSPRMASATLQALARLLYDFHDLLGVEIVKTLLTSACTLLSSRTREVVKSTLGLVKVVIGVLPALHLEPHLDDLVSSVLSWGEDSKNHFRLKARVILERLVRKFGYERVAGVVPEKHKKLIVHIEKMNERQKRKKREKHEQGGSGSESTRVSKPSYEDLMMDSSDDEKDVVPKKQAKKAVVKDSAWLKEGTMDDPLDFMSEGAIRRVVANRPRLAKPDSKKAQPFVINPEGKLVITEDDDVMTSGEPNKLPEPQDESVGGPLLNKGEVRKRKRGQLEVEDDDDDEEAGNTRGTGIHRKNPNKHEYNFDYGSEYRSKKAKGDMKRPGKPDPFAYVPLIKQKLDKRKQAKLSGQFNGLMNKARKGSTQGLKQHKQRK